MIILVICYAPSFLGLVCGSMIYIISGDGGDTSMMNYVIPWVILPTDLNSGVNALVFILRNYNIVQFYKSFITKRKKENAIEIK